MDNRLAVLRGEAFSRRNQFPLLLGLIVLTGIYLLLPLGASYLFARELSQYGYERVIVQLGYPGIGGIHVPVVSLQQNLGGETLLISLTNVEIQYSLPKLVRGHVDSVILPDVAVQVLTTHRQSADEAGDMTESEEDADDELPWSFLTVNDLLVLYRAIHAARYQPSPELESNLKHLASQRATRALAAEIYKAINESRQKNPSMLIPMDASRRAPRERLYPLSLQVPVAELDLLHLHEQTIRALNAYEGFRGDRPSLYAKFEELQRTYLASLAGFGSIFNKLKEIAIQGESASVGALKFFAHMPAALLRLFDQGLTQFDVFNNLIKGNEVFSNIGAVVPSSSLKRFVTAKDDNEDKQLVWGVITDANGVMHLSLRDFRPHVAALRAIQRADLAHQITRDYLDAYVKGFNNYIFDLQRITLARRKTLPEH